MISTLTLAKKTLIYEISVYNEKTNNNGHLRLDLALERKMQITNTKFQKKHSKLWTYVSDMTNLKSQVDYILINRKWTNSVKDVCAHNSFVSTGSDHRLLRAKIKMSFCTKKTPGQIRHDWALLRGIYSKPSRYHYKTASQFFVIIMTILMPLNDMSTLFKPIKRLPKISFQRRKEYARIKPLMIQELYEPEKMSNVRLIPFSTLRLVTTN